MRVIILAAGAGSRLGAITNNIPKPLIEINGKSMIERQIELFRKNDISDIVITTGSKKEKFTIKDVSYVHDAEFNSHDQLGSLMASRQKISGDVIILFADLLFEENIVKQILESNTDIGIAVEENWRKSYSERPDRDQAAKVSIKNGKVISISEKYASVDAEKVVEFIGIIKLSSKGSEILKEKYQELETNHEGVFNDAKSLNKGKLTDLLQELIKSNFEIDPIVVNGKWCEVDTPNDLEIAKTLFY